MRVVVRSVGVLLILGAVAAAALAVAAPAVSAATLEVSNAKPCFGSGDTVNFFGTGFTPGGIVDFSRDGAPMPADPPITAAEDGSVEAELTILKRSGQQQRTYAATGRTDPTKTASTPVIVSDLDVTVRPTRGDPALLRHISAKGFTTGSRTLWAHAVFRGSVRNVRIGTLKGACGSLRAKKRLFGQSAPLGRRLIHFDTSRMFRKRAAQRVSFSFRISGEQRPPIDCQGYSPCLPPGPDVDCRGGSGDGPRYVDGPVYVRGDDPYRLDSNGDGVGCES